MSALCLLTIHGIGFQQRPEGGIPGYADQLHQNLRRCLPVGALGDDPNRPEGGPVYVESTWPPGGHATEPALARLGRWDDQRPWYVINEGKPLVGGDAPIAHVALVYSHLEEAGGDATALEEMALMGVAGLSHYSSLLGSLRLMFHDVAAIMASHQAGRGAPPASGMQVRADLDQARHRTLAEHLLHRRAAPASDAVPAETATGPLAGLRQLEDDVAAYMCRNQLRERVRAFVREAVMRLAFREDVSGIVVNGHSNGTVIGYDILSALPGPSAKLVRALITAGSPLRKYADLLAWGENAETLGEIKGPWLNFWDPLDPVADPLAPAMSWRRSDALPTEAPGMFVCYDPDTGAARSVAVRDIQVDNVANSAGGGLRAHNYWDNREFSEPVAALLSQLCGLEPAVDSVATTHR